MFNNIHVKSQIEYKKGDMDWKRSCSIFIILVYSKMYSIKYTHLL